MRLSRVSLAVVVVALVLGGLVLWLDGPDEAADEGVTGLDESPWSSTETGRAAPASPSLRLVEVGRRLERRPLEAAEGVAHLVVALRSSSESAPVEPWVVTIIPRESGAPVAAEITSMVASHGTAEFRFERAVVIEDVIARTPGRPVTAWGRPVVIRQGDVIPIELTVAAGARVSGVVVTTDGEAVPFARVDATCHAGTFDAPSFEEPSAAACHETIADADGRFTLEGVGPRVTVRAGSRDGVSLWGCTLDLTGRPAFENVRLVLAPPRTARVHVVDADGMSLSGASVRASEWSSPSSRPSLPSGGRALEPLMRVGITDAMGMVVFERLASERIRLVVEHEAGAATFATIETRPSTERVSPTDVVMSEGAVVFGWVRGTEVGATIRTDLLAEARSEVDGRYSLGHVPEQATRVVCCSAPGSAVGVASIPEGPGPHRIDFELAPSARLAGRIASPDGLALIGARVRVVSERRLPGFKPDLEGEWTPERLAGLDVLVTDDLGRFAFDGLADGSVELEVTDPEEPSVVLHAQLQTGRDDLALVFDAAQAAPAKLVLTVSDAVAGEPITSFQVNPARASDRGVIGRALAFTDPRGQATLDVPAEKTWLTVEAPGYRAWRDVLDLKAGVTEVDVRLDPAVDLRVKVVTPQGASLAARVAVHDDEQRPLSLGGTTASIEVLAQGADGALLRGLPAGRVSMIVTPLIAPDPFGPRRLSPASVERSLDLSIPSEREQVVVMDSPLRSKRHPVLLTLLRAQDEAAKSWIDQPVRVTVVDDEGDVRATYRIEPDAGGAFSVTTGGARSTIESPRLRVSLSQIPMTFRFEMPEGWADPLRVDPMLSESGTGEYEVVFR